MPASLTHEQPLLYGLPANTRRKEHSSEGVVKEGRCETKCEGVVKDGRCETKCEMKFRQNDLVPAAAGTGSDPMVKRELKERARVLKICIRPVTSFKDGEGGESASNQVESAGVCLHMHTDVNVAGASADVRLTQLVESDDFALSTVQQVVGQGRMHDTVAGKEPAGSVHNRATQRV